MIEIKGSMFVNLITGIRESFGEEGYARVLEAISPDSREFFQNQSMLASKWYPFDPFVEMLNANVRLFHSGDATRLIPGAEESTNKALKGMYRVFTRLSSPSSIVQKTDSINKAFFQGISGTSKMVDQKTFVSQFNGFKPEHAVFENIVIAFFRSMLRVSGAENIRAVFTVPMSEGKPFSELTVTWD